MLWFYFGTRDMLAEHDTQDESEVARLAEKNPDVIFFEREDT